MEQNARCSLQDMLDARDRRSERQRLHFETTPEATLVVATVVAPGEFKLSPHTDIMARAMIESLKERFAGHILHLEHIAPVSGHEVWLTLDCPMQEAKQIAVGIEDSHMLGRLFDIDVIQADLRPLSRSDVGMQPRKCLLCQNEARLCMRMHKHTPEEINSFIENLIVRYAR